MDAAPGDAISPAPMPKLRVLVLGGGGRDDALCHAFAASPLAGELHAAPGNAGMARVATCHPEVALDDLDAMVALARRIEADLVIVGSEDLLVAGLGSRIEAAGIPCLGPSKDAAQLEGSKAFAKELMEQVGIPTPSWVACATPAEALEAVHAFGGAAAVKADGIASGCGAFVCRTVAEAEAAITTLMVDRAFGASGDCVIVEQLVDGDEASVMALVDGTHIVPLPPVRDYKRLGTGDTGPNTGGMGAHAPATDLSASTYVELAHELIQPIVDELARRGTPYRGAVYAGVMLTAEGPTVLEYNSRFGNPETQALVRILDVDLLELVWRTAFGRLRDVDAPVAVGAAAAVCIAAEHYPDLQLEPAPVLVTGLDDAASVPGVVVFHGLTEQVAGSTDAVLAAGGRVVTVSAHADTIDEARARAYDAAARITCAGSHLRADVGAEVGVPAR